MSRLIGYFFVLLILQLGGPIRAAKKITAFGLPGCIEIKNENTRVVLDPNIGGRVLIYEINGKNILYFDSEHEGITDGYAIQRIDAGRFDFGPTQTLPKRDVYWKGKWKAEITGEYSGRLISQVDTVLMIQLIRDFVLDKNSSKLTCTQTIKNIGSRSKELFHWGRTFVHGGGISLTPLNPESRFPLGYIAYYKHDKEMAMHFKVIDEPNLRVRDHILEIFGPTRCGKLVMDGEDGWMGYISPDDLLFVKKFKHHPQGHYGEMTAATMSVWSAEHNVYEIEPYGPLEEIKPGQSVSFTEEWYLIEYTFPKDAMLNLNKIKQIIRHL